MSEGGGVRAWKFDRNWRVATLSENCHFKISLNGPELNYDITVYAVITVWCSTLRLSRYRQHNGLWSSRISVTTSGLEWLRHNVEITTLTLAYYPISLLFIPDDSGRVPCDRKRLSVAAVVSRRSNQFRWFHYPMWTESWNHRFWAADRGLTMFDDPPCQEQDVELHMLHSSTVCSTGSQWASFVLPKVTGRL